MTDGTSDDRHHRYAYRIAGLVFVVLLCGVLAAVYVQFRGGFTPVVRLTMLASRAGLVMDPGAKVTYNGVPIGRVAAVHQVDDDGAAKAELMLDVSPEYIPLIPANVDASITATTIFGKKYVSLLAPQNPTAHRVSDSHVIDAVAVTTEFNTLFETVMQISEKIDPIKLNATLTATAEALEGLGPQFGRSIVTGNTILARLNERMPQIRYDLRRLADLIDVYIDASPRAWEFLHDAATTARAFNDHRSDIDAALLSAIGFGNTGADVLDRGSPYLIRALSDLRTTSALLDEYSPQLYCMIRNYHDAAPAVSAAVGGNGYSAIGIDKALGAENPYVYPDNLPRVNASGGPGGRPGCWQPITRDLWPAPYLVMDSGNSVAPYNHFELGQPMFTEYVWGRQVGENTINP